MNKITKNFLLMTVVFFSLGFMRSSFAQQNLFEQRQPRTSKEAKFRPGEILVKFKESVSEKTIRGIHQKHGSSMLSISERGKFRRLGETGDSNLFFIKI